ncbi:SUN domain-containing protein 2-like [Trachinotus anak]|uniref:SUN domain-containing protein 2-like n=1 Tax=Trachinotus anak TaxID=443729 RepID=UPI0039F1D03D
MLRRSIRLETSQYFDTNGEPSISYRETMYRVFIRRKTRCLSQPEGREASSKRRFVLCIIPLCLGLAYLTFTLNTYFLDSGLSESPVPPAIQTTDPTALGEEMEKQVREMQGELLRLKRQMNYLLPVADILPNFALESLGAEVVLHLSSKAYQTQGTSVRFFGIPIMQSLVHPRTVIQGHSLLPGRCWAFAGGQGHLVITLSQPITISHVTLGHISKNLSPTGTITSAPKEFSVYAMETLDDEGTQLGIFLYDHEGCPVQTFKIADNKRGVFIYVKLQVESNWGHPDYSCLYDFRVHGKLADN